MSTTIRIASPVETRALLMDPDNQPVDATLGTPAVETWTDADFDDYLLTPTQLGTSGIWVYDLDDVAGLAAGQYDLLVYRSASPVVTDAPWDAVPVVWSGSVVIDFHRALISTATPASGDQSTWSLRERLLMLTRGAFAKTVWSRDEGKRKHYADDGSTVIAEQPVTDDGTTQTLGAADDPA